MKRRSLQLFRALLPAVLVFGAVFTFAQAPANDKCEDAITLEIAASKGACNPVEGDTRNTTDGNLDNIPACSVNFKRDDIWYKFVAPDTENGWTIEFEFGTSPTDIPSVGLAVYASCDATAANQPLFCAVEKTDRQLLVDVCPALTPGVEYLLRVWSAVGVDPNWTEGAGTFRICAYENDPITGEVIWGGNPGEGDFDGGINNWTAEAISCFGGDAANATWVWEPIGSALAGAYATGQVLGSKTYCNGAMVFNSDFLDNGGTTLPSGAPNTANGTCNAPQEAALVSPLIDISSSTAENISLEFHQNLRQFQSRYYVGYSLDGGANWIDVEINQEFEVNSAHINEVRRVPLPGAAGSANLQVRFRIEGNYYYWVIDDVRIIERECVNMRANEFFAIAPNAMWQRDQLTDFPALIDIENIGACDQENVVVEYTIRNEAGDVVYTATKDYGTIASDSLAENQPFDACVQLPADLPDGLYTGTYTVSSDGVEFDPSNNSQSFSFMIVGDRMAKEFEIGAYSGLRPSADFSYTMGNYYYIVNGEDYTVCQVELGLSNANQLTPSAIGTQAFVVVTLYEWNDLNNDGDAQINEGELTPAGVAELQFQDGDPASTIFTLDLLDVETFEGCVQLKNNTAYILAMNYTVPTGLEAPLFMLMSRNFNYSATRFATHPAFLDQCTVPQYGEFIAVGASTDVLGNGAFNSGEVPVLRLLLTDGTSSTEDPSVAVSQNVSMTILPNPVSDVLQVNFDFAASYEQVNVRVSDITGRLVFSENIAGGQQSSWTRNVSHLANGTYMITVSTPHGVTTERFMVQR